MCMQIKVTTVYRASHPTLLIGLCTWGFVRLPSWPQVPNASFQCLSHGLQKLHKVYCDSWKQATRQAFTTHETVPYHSLSAWLLRHSHSAIWFEISNPRSSLPYVTKINGIPDPLLRWTKAQVEYSSCTRHTGTLSSIFVKYKESVEVWLYGNRLIHTNPQAICMLPWKPMWVWLVITAYINHPNIKFYQSWEWR